MGFASATETLLEHFNREWANAAPYITDEAPDSSDLIHGDTPFVSVYIYPRSFRARALGRNNRQSAGNVRMELYHPEGGNGPHRDALLDRLKEIFFGIDIGTIRCSAKVRIDPDLVAGAEGWRMIRVSVPFTAQESSCPTTSKS